MSQFNTHGGYFAPKGYFKVNSGGSHEENPNGGVQVGVDPQGVPNMLEEGEPVYNDYVYSDNITADAAMLETHNIPKKFAGKLYSDIADKILEEAEERPNDPISNNGLNAMLVRLAEAQEEQKQVQQQKEVEDELSQMSPEELEMLEQMVAQQGAEEAAPVQEEFAPEMAEEQAVPQMPVMANGGFIRSFYPGGFRPSRENQELTEYILNELNKKNVNVNPETGMRYELPLQDIHPELDLALAVAQPGTLLEKALAPSMARGVVEGLASGEGAQSLMMATPAGKVKTVFSAEKELKVAGKEISKARAGKNMLNESTDAYKSAQSAWRKAESEATKATERFNATVDEFDRLKSSLSDMDAVGADLQKTQAEMRLEFLAGKAEKLGEKAAAANKTAASMRKTLDKAQASFEKVAEKQGVDANKLLESSEKKAATSGGTGFPTWAKWALPAAGTTGALVGIPAAMNTWGTPNYEMPYVPEEPEAEPADTVASPVVADTTAQKALYGGGLFGNGWDYACGGKMNRFDWGSFMERLGNYKVSTNAGKIKGTYAIDRKFPLAGFSTINDLENSDKYKAFTDYILANPTNANVLSYLKALDDGTAKGVAKLGTVGADGSYTLNKGWEDLYKKRRTDHKGGIYHFVGDNLDDLESLYAPAAPTPATVTPQVQSANTLNLLNYNIPPLPFGQSVSSPNPDYPAFSVDTPFQHAAGRTGDVRWSNETQSFEPVSDALYNYRYLNTSYDPYLGMDMRTPYQKWADENLGKITLKNPVEEAIASAEPEEPEQDINGDVVKSDVTGNATIYPVFPMYAGALGSGLLAINAALQEPDRYDMERVRPVTPYGRINIQHQVYNPIDENRLANEAIAQGNATARAVQNSGLGPSAGAALLASDAATQHARGEGFLQAWDANNQRRNQVIAANNAAEAQKAQFEFGVDSARANAINYANMMNQRYAMMIDQLNREAEQQKYAAVGANINNALQALSEIGRQNFIFNQLNTNRALYDQVWPNGAASYKGKEKV